MPYKAEGNTVWVMRDGRWYVLKRHNSHAEALAHLAALNINVVNYSPPARALSAGRARWHGRQT
jgi:hypothetical protein